MAEDDLDVREGAKGPKVGLLTSRLVGIVGPGLHSRGEVLDAGDGILSEESPTELREIEPLEGGILEASVVEIEPIDLDVGSQGVPPGFGQ